MAVNKVKVTIGFMVGGVFTVFFGTVLTFVGPIVIDDQVVKVSVVLTGQLACLHHVYTMFTAVFNVLSCAALCPVTSAHRLHTDT